MKMTAFEKIIWGIVYGLARIHGHNDVDSRYGGEPAGDLADEAVFALRERVEEED